MGKGTNQRLNDTLGYLQGHFRAIGLTATEARDFEERVRSKDEQLDYTGDLLSLGWSRFGDRPDQDNRHAIRLCLLASACGDYTKQKAARRFVKAEALTLKTKTILALHTEIATRVRAVLAQTEWTIKAATYVLDVPGGPSYATAVSRLLDEPVEEAMLEIRKSVPGGGVMLIDMQSRNVGHEYFGGRSVLAHQQKVLMLAGLHDMIVYDIVIDKGHAERRQAKTVFTVPELSDAYADGKVRHISKPGHPSFEGTDLAKTLKQDEVKWLVVMGYDANQCVKATIFGGPENTQPVHRERSKSEQKAYLLEHPNVKDGNEVIYDRTGTRKVPYMPGLLDRGIGVLTSRAILASGALPLDQEYGVLRGQ